MNDTPATYAPQLRCEWVVKETSDPGGGHIQICTADGRFRIFGMFHSSFGVSSGDKLIAQHVVDLHNASLESGE